MQENSETFYHILSNGLKIVLRQVESDVAYVGVMVGAGTRNEEVRENGMAHYIEHCVFKGTAHHSARQIIRSIEGVGGEINAYTTKEETTFYAAVPSHHIRKTLSLIGEMVLQPLFLKSETDKETTVIKDEIASYEDSPSELIYDDFESLVFAGHSLALPILGTRKSLRYVSASPERPKNWMAKYYRPENTVVFMEGRMQPRAFVKVVEQLFGDWFNPEARPMLLPAPEMGVSGAEECVYHRRTHQVHVMMGGAAYPLGHRLQLPMYLMNNIIGGGSLNSRLNLRLREQRGLVYTVESTYTPLSDTGYWCVYYACEPEHAARCAELVRREMMQLREHPLQPEAIRKALVQLRGQMAIAADNRENRSLAMAKSMLYHGYAPSWQEVYDKVAQTTAEDLRQVTEEVLNPDGWKVLRYE